MHAPMRALGLAVLAALVSAPLPGQTVSPPPDPTAWPTGTTVTAPRVHAPLEVGPAPGVPGPSPLLSQDAERNRRKGALWGGAVGLVAGGILGGLSVGSGEDNGIIDEALVESAATGPAVVLGAVLGAGVGALLGATVFAPDRPGSASVSPGLAIRVDPGRAPPGTAIGIGIGLRWWR